MAAAYQRTFGAAHPLPLSALLAVGYDGGIAWASFTCLSSAPVAAAIGGQPVLSLIISIGITTALLAFLYRRVRTSWEQSKADMALES